jgi:glycosyltransferase involved in cell wall biosynthesis
MNRALRVLHVIPSVGPRRGGPSVALDTMARALAEAGVDVHVATTDDDAAGRVHVPLGRPVKRAGATYHYFRRQTRFYTVSWPLRRWLANNVQQFDIVHVHALFSFASVVACRAARAAGIPYIVRPLGVLSPYGLRQRAVLKSWSLRLLERPLLDNAAAVHCTSEAEQSEVRQLNRHWRTVVVPLAVDTKHYAPARRREWLEQHLLRGSDRPIALFLSRIDPKKGLELLLAAVAQARSEVPDLVLVVAGTGDAVYVEQLQEKARVLGIADLVMWVGHLTGTEKLEALQSADVFVLPSYAENFGLAVVEALACGVPAVVSEHVAVARDIAAGEAGLVIKQTVPAIKDALVEVLRDSANRTRMAGAARALAVQEFSLASMSDRLIALYRSARK